MNRRILVIHNKPEYQSKLQPVLSPSAAPTVQGNLAVQPEVKKSPFDVTFVETGAELTSAIQKAVEAKTHFAGVIVDYDFLPAGECIELIRRAKETDPHLLWLITSAQPEARWEELHQAFGQEFLDRWDVVEKQLTGHHLLQKTWRLASSWDRRQRERAFVAQIKTSEEQLIKTERLAAIGTLARGIGNELGNTLQTIITKAEIALTKKTAPDMETALKTIVTQVEKASGVVKNLQSLVKMETTREVASIEGPIKESLQLIEFEMKKSKVAFVPEYDGVLPNVKLNRFEINQAFLNIMVNAVHAMEKKGGTLTIKTVNDEKGVSIHFIDSGSGIPKENLEKIFEPLFTTKVGSGTGIGLSVTRRIVENHGGKLSVTSEVGKGTDFVIWLPKA